MVATILRFIAFTAVKVSNLINVRKTSFFIRPNLTFTLIKGHQALVISILTTKQAYLLTLHYLSGLTKRQVERTT